MPQFILEIPNSEETISTPIIVSALTRIIRTYKWYEDFDFNYNFFGGGALVKGSEIDLPTFDRSQQRLPSDQKVMVEVSERYNEDAVRATHIKQGTQQNIFTCDKTKTTMHPGYQQMITDVSMKFRFRTRHAAENFRKRVHLASTKSVDGMRIQVKYSYIIPYAFLDILNRIYTMMEAKHGYGIDLGTWLRQSFTSNLTTLGSRSKVGKTVMAMEENNLNVLVLVNSPDEIGEKDKENDDDSWTVNMEFSIFYDRPDVMRIRFQHIVNNQFIGMDIANRFKVLKQDYLNARTDMAQLDAIRSGEVPVGNNPLSGVNSPIFDDWLAPNFNKNYPDLIRSMIVLDETNFKSIIDFNDITDYELTPQAIDWLKRTHSTVTEFGKNIFWVRLWAWDKFSGNNTYTMDNNLLLTSTDDLDPRINYHVTIGICTNPEVLDQGVWDELGRDRPMLQEYLTAISPSLSNVINNILIDYNNKYPDTSENSWFDTSVVFDPDAVSVLPSYVIERIKEVLLSPGTGTGKGGKAGGSGSGAVYDQNHPNVQGPNGVSNPGSVFNSGIGYTGSRQSLMKTSMLYGVLVKRKE